MTATIRASFEQRIVMLPLASITLLRQIPPAIINGRKYQKIAGSIREVGLV